MLYYKMSEPVAFKTPAPVAPKIYLAIPFEVKDEAKKNKCRWCPERKMWYCINSKNPMVEKYLFSFFDVPFELKDRAKELGARWDGVNKSWYSYQGNTALIALLEEESP
jgi:hypothetical protein